jgi:hypothetical protein
VVDQWHFAKTTAEKCSSRKENFFPPLASDRYAKPSRNVALAVWTRSSLMNARWVTLDPVYNTGISE